MPLVLFACAILAGAWRFGWGAWLMALGLFWGLQVTFFTTFFINVRTGLASGIAGSLGYWLTQHEVARGGPGRESRRLWLAFMIWWTAASWIGCASAGERMPWLLVHQVLPLCLLAGWGARRLVAPLECGSARGAKWLLVGGAALAVVTVAGALRSSPFTGRDPHAVAATARWLVWVLVQAGLLGVMAQAASHVSRRETRRLVGLGVVLLGFVLTARASAQLSFVNIDRPAEPLSYAQSSPDVTRIVREIETIDQRSGGQHTFRIAVDDETLFPLSWYLRDYPNTVSWRADPAVAASATAIVVGLRNRAAWPLVTRGYSRQRGILYWWPLQGYAALTPSTFWAWLTDPAQRQYLWQVFMYRRYGIDERAWLGNREFDFYVRDDAGARRDLRRR